ncbi:peptidyl-prolyl cis-trans isomerase, FKBP-type family protein [Trichomonas vaginalis G3]|uniref:peptidylprolyl isomerase n=1 Tax=Trichomonas vaginalis (strain ATCC PRA-98 / G3) TaxID=412133 RepID=A2FER9_TRIV3|nr:histone peptidyl-prolyl isomerization [Trichomonas vaginalis G3]EAX96606.1 peptidyl-prolyl cis-trans isomerase, FKBP-type family protein [Trichomonas vaginalis G3]KAI5524105.1 histone peptidyl-prolyl isomerization [Trichomonas vaginalis G3]|eukprot:XP_001309536.1 peptidyl-prolyl cis-trans isomerase, FKBP-type family protein [Trichomonas vaginalis G3]
MSALDALFGAEQSIDKVSFKYKPKIEQAKPEQPAFPYMGQIFLYQYNTQENKNVDYGKFMLIVKPNPPAHNIVIYQNQNQPFLQIQVTTSMKFNLREKIFGYITDQSGIQWTIRFSDNESAARFAITVGSILENTTGAQMSVYDALIGNGQIVDTDDTVSVSYIGFLGGNLPTTGKKFDANESYSFTIGSDKTIKGWSQGAIGMHVGGTRALFIPPELAYGPNAVAGGLIPPNSILTFLITITSSKSNKPQTQHVVQQQPQQQQQPVQKPVQAPVTQVQPQSTPIAPKKEEEAPATSFSDKMKRIGAVFMPGMPAPASHSVSDTSDYQTNETTNTSDSSRTVQQTYQAPAPQQPVSSPQPERIREVVKVVNAPTVDEAQVLARMDQLNALLTSKFDQLMSKANEEMPTAVLCDEIQQMAADLDRKERQIRDQERLIAELKGSKSGVRLKQELDSTATELEQLRSVLRGSKDLRKENEDLKAELRNIRERNLTKLESDVHQLQDELASQRQRSSAEAASKAKELFFGFMGSAVEQLKQRFDQMGTVPADEVTAIVSDVFRKCQERTFRQIDEDGLL